MSTVVSETSTSVILSGSGDLGANKEKICPLSLYDFYPLVHTNW